MKLGFIGAGGNMAGAIINSILSAQQNLNESQKHSFYLYSPHAEKLDKYKEQGCNICSSNSEAVQKSDYIFLCVKPQILPSVLSEIKSAASAEKCFVSIAAGVKIDTIKQQLGFDAKVIRVMPNTPLSIGFGASGMCRKSPVCDDEFEFVKTVLSGDNLAVCVDESQMDAVTAISGSGPAYVYRFIIDMQKAGEQIGLSNECAMQLTLATVQGAVEMVKRTGVDVNTLLKNVISPGGTTYAAMCSMDKDGFDSALNNAIKACFDRSAELSQN